MFLNSITGCTHSYISMLQGPTARSW